MAQIFLFYCDLYNLYGCEGGSPCYKPCYKSVPVMEVNFVWIFLPHIVKKIYKKKKNPFFFPCLWLKEKANIVQLFLEGINSDAWETVTKVFSKTVVKVMFSAIPYLWELMRVAHVIVLGEHYFSNLIKKPFSFFFSNLKFCFIIIFYFKVSDYPILVMYI